MNRSLLWMGSLLLAMWPVWLWYGRRMTDGSDEPYGIIALAIGLILLWRNRADLAPTRRSGVIATLLLIVLTLAGNTLPNLVSALFAIAILAIAAGNGRRNPGIWMVLALSLPLIASMQFYLGYPIRLFAARSAEILLNGAGLGVERSGVQLLWRGNEVGVDPPCSGVEMLWMGLLVVASLSAVRKYRPARFLAAMAVGSVAIVAANSVRVSLLFIKESGMISLPEWTHEGIGVALFAGLVWIAETCLRRTGPPSRGKFPPSKLPPAWAAKLAFAALLAALFPFASSGLAPNPPKAAQDFPGWPTQWRGRYLEAISLTEAEASFAKDFPGQIGIFSTGPDKVIIRWVTRPTRKLHSSADCLRAAGYRIEKERAGRFIAERAEDQYLVEETIYNSQDQWNEVSPWFWAATLRKTVGPWWAVTVIRSFHSSRQSSDERSFQIPKHPSPPLVARRDQR